MSHICGRSGVTRASTRAIKGFKTIDPIIALKPPNSLIDEWICKEKLLFMLVGLFSEEFDYKNYTIMKIYGAIQTIYI
jgi:hypothetical protein